jgi:hypothetical protein
MVSSVDEILSAMPSGGGRGADALVWLESVLRSGVQARRRTATSLDGGMIAVRLPARMVQLTHSPLEVTRVRRLA